MPLVNNTSFINEYFAFKIVCLHSNECSVIGNRLLYAQFKFINHSLKLDCYITFL